MDTVRRGVGALLLLTAAIVGIYFVVDQMGVLPGLWTEINYLMAPSVALGVIFAYGRKRALESAGLDRIVTRHYLEANILFYGFLLIAMLFFWNFFGSIFDARAQDASRSSIGIGWVIVDTAGPLLLGALGMFLLRGGSEN